jgi:hypothetical protein
MREEFYKMRHEVSMIRTVTTSAWPWPPARVADELKPCFKALAANDESYALPVGKTCGNPACNTPSQVHKTLRSMPYEIWG